MLTLYNTYDIIKTVKEDNLLTNRTIKYRVHESARCKNDVMINPLELVFDVIRQ